jgi:dipeptidyl aminopeptidase/acylaminoacyl peptidase
MRRGRQELRRRSLLDGDDRLVATAEEIMAPRWSHDGTALAFRRLSTLDGREHRQKESAIVLVSSTDGRERLLTTPGTRLLTPSDWSPDGQTIVGGCEQGGTALISLCLFPVSSAPRAQEQMRVIAMDPERNLHQGTFAPNQRWIAFIATSVTGLSTIYVMAPEGGPWTAITEGTFWDDKPRWSPDGHTLYFVSNRSGFLNVWGRRFIPETGKPSGEPFVVTSFDGPKRGLSTPMNTLELAVGPSQLILPITEASGAVWVLENTAR